MKILIIPDVHGRTFWREALELVDKVDKIVFLGDYLDPYPNENIAWEDALNEFIRILQFKDSYNDKVILLTGNHDWHYINKGFPDCSRRNYKLLDELNGLFTKNINKFQLIYETENYLFSHAGIYKEWMELCNFNLDNLKDFNEIITNNWPSLTCVGFYRGGYHPVGSCIWADIRESLNHELYSDKKQIVGHTQLNGEPYITNKINCLDCRECFTLNTETNEIIKVTEKTNLETKS